MSEMTTAYHAVEGAIMAFRAANEGRDPERVYISFGAFELLNRRCLQPESSVRPILGSANYSAEAERVHALLTDACRVLTGMPDLGVCPLVTAQLKIASALDDVLSMVCRWRWPGQSADAAGSLRTFMGVPLAVISKPGIFASACEPS